MKTTLISMALSLASLFASAAHADPLTVINMSPSGYVISHGDHRAPNCGEGVLAVYEGDTDDDDVIEWWHYEENDFHACRNAEVIFVCHDITVLDGYAGYIASCNQED